MQSSLHRVQRARVPLRPVVAVDDAVEPHPRRRPVLQAARRERVRHLVHVHTQRERRRRRRQPLRRRERTLRGAAARRRRRSSAGAAASAGVGGGERRRRRVGAGERLRAVDAEPAALAPAESGVAAAVARAVAQAPRLLWKLAEAAALALEARRAVGVGHQVVWRLLRRAAVPHLLGLEVVVLLGRARVGGERRQVVRAVEVLERLCPRPNPVPGGAVALRVALVAALAPHLLVDHVRHRPVAGAEVAQRVRGPPVGQLRRAVRRRLTEVRQRPLELARVASAVAVAALLVAVALRARARACALSRRLRGAELRAARIAPKPRRELRARRTGHAAS